MNIINEILISLLKVLICAFIYFIFLDDDILKFIISLVITVILYKIVLILKQNDKNN